MAIGVGIVPHWWIWWLQSQVRITRLAVSAIADLAAEGSRLGSRDHKCVMMATRVC